MKKNKLLYFYIILIFFVLFIPFLFLGVVEPNKLKLDSILCLVLWLTPILAVAPVAYYTIKDANYIYKHLKRINKKLENDFEFNNCFDRIYIENIDELKKATIGENKKRISLITFYIIIAVIVLIVSLVQVSSDSILTILFIEVIIALAIWIVWVIIKAILRPFLDKEAFEKIYKEKILKNIVELIDKNLTYKTTYNDFEECGSSLITYNREYFIYKPEINSRIYGKLDRELYFEVFAYTFYTQYEVNRIYIAAKIPIKSKFSVKICNTKLYVNEAKCFEDVLNCRFKDTNFTNDFLTDDIKELLLNFCKNTNKFFVLEIVEDKIFINFRENQLFSMSYKLNKSTMKKRIYADYDFIKEVITLVKKLTEKIESIN